MAIAPAQLDALTQGLIDKMMARVDERLDAHEKKAKPEPENQLWSSAANRQTKS